MKKTFISVNESEYCTYVMDPFEAWKDCYAGQVLHDGYTELLGLLTVKYENCEVV